MAGNAVWRRGTPQLLPLIVVCTLLAVLFGVGTHQLGSPPLVAVIAMVVGIGVLESFVARVSAGTEGWTVSVTETVLVVVLVFYPGAWVVPAGAVAMLLAQLLRRRHDPYKIAFNVSMYAAVFGLASWVTARMIDKVSAGVFAGSAGAATAGLLAFWVANVLLVAVGMRLAQGAAIIPTLRETVPLSAAHLCVNLCVGLSAAVMISVHPLTVVGLIIPMVAIMSSYSSITSRIEEAKLLTEMLAQQGRARIRSAEEHAQVVMQTAMSVFTTSEVELLMLRSSDGPLLFTLDPVTGSPRGQLATQAHLDRSWVLRSLSSASAVSVGHTLSTSWCTLRIGERSDPLAVLMLRREVGSSTGFVRAERRLAKALVSRAEAWLREGLAIGAADAALDVSLSAESRSAAVAAVRSAAFRLVSEAEHAAIGDATELITGLHRVERATTALLGTLSVSGCSPDAAGPSAAPGASRYPKLVVPDSLVDDDWVVLPASEVH